MELKSSHGFTAASVQVFKSHLYGIEITTLHPCALTGGEFKSHLYGIEIAH